MNYSVRMPVRLADALRGKGQPEPTTEMSAREFRACLRRIAGDGGYGKILAIKYAREILELDLMEAKRYVEAVCKNNVTKRRRISSK